MRCAGEADDYAIARRLSEPWSTWNPTDTEVRACPADDAFSLVREQMVTGVSRRPLPLSETPSSVTVIPAAEISAMGYRTLGEALRWVRGLFVTDDRNYTFLGVRGLQRPGDYNNKILLTLDGHSLNGAVYGDAAIGPELGLDLEQVERIEVVRGPGSTFYGSYAALAVVNVVTRRPHGEPGARFDLRAGGAGQLIERAHRPPPGPARGSWTGSSPLTAMPPPSLGSARRVVHPPRESLHTRPPSAPRRH